MIGHLDRNRSAGGDPRMSVRRIAGSFLPYQQAEPWNVEIDTWFIPGYRGSVATRPIDRADGARWSC